MQGQNPQKLSEKGLALSSYPAAALCHTKAEVLQQEGLVCGQEVANTVTAETWHCHHASQGHICKGGLQGGPAGEGLCQGTGTERLQVRQMHDPSTSLG